MSIFTFMPFDADRQAPKTQFELSQTAITLIVYVLPVLIGFVIRSIFIMGPSIWADEGQHILISLAPNVFEMRETYSTTAHDQPYGMYVLLHYWVNIFGVTPFALRFFALFNSTIGILTTALAARMIFKDRKMVFVSALLMALSPFAIRYGFDVTPYCILNALIPLSFGLFVRDLLNKNSVPGLSLILVNAALINIHYFSYFFVAAQIIISIVFSRQELKKIIPGILLACGIYLIASIPILLLFDPMLAKGNHWWIEVGSRNYFSMLLSLFAYGFFEKIVVFTVLIAGMVFVFMRIKEFKDSQKVVLTAVIAIIFTTIFLVFVSKFLFWDVFGHERYFMVIFPLLIVSIVISIYWGFKRKLIHLILTGIVITAMSFSIIFHMPKQNIHDFKSAVEFIEKSNQQSKNNILVIPECCRWAILYYLEYYQIDIRVEPIDDSALLTKKETVDYLKEKAKEFGSKKLYLILYYDSINYANQLGSVLGKIAEPLEKRDFKGVKVLEFSYSK